MIIIFVLGKKKPSFSEKNGLRIITSIGIIDKGYLVDIETTNRKILVSENFCLGVFFFSRYLEWGIGLIQQKNLLQS